MERTQAQQDLIELLLDLFDGYAPVVDVDDQGRVVSVQVTIPVANLVKNVDGIIEHPYPNVGS